MSDDLTSEEQARQRARTQREARVESMSRQLYQEAEAFRSLRRRGRVSRASGLLIEASGLEASLGEMCELRSPGVPVVPAQVVGFEGGYTLLTPLGETTGISTSTEVVPSGRDFGFLVGRSLLGRVVDGLGQPIDGAGPVKQGKLAQAFRSPPDALKRPQVRQPLPTGVRVLDTMMTLGEGQRMGIFAPPGVGKSTLLGMIARGSRADVNVIALVGERGREVNEFLDHSLSPAARARSVVVVATSDRPAMERVKSAYVATAIAEHFRDQGAKVMLLVDSLSRFARAQRDVGLAAGEPPARRGYPPSVFSQLPQLLERAGPAPTGSITALYTVLVEGEEDSDPVAEEVKSILDGHVILSRKLGLAAQYPSIDPLASLSRVASQVCGETHREAASRARSLLAKYQEIELLLQMGEYQAGRDPLADVAVQLRPQIMALFAQRVDEASGFDEAVAALAALVGL
jgi:type III secretion protein N (ATPase)